MLSPPPPAPAGDGTPEFLHYVTTGDSGSLEGLLRDCTPTAYAQAWRTLGNRTDAEDAVQEALIQLVRTAGDYDARIPFPAWLGRLVQVACWHLRRQQTRRHHREHIAMSLATPSIPDQDLHDQVRDAVARLPEGDRTVIELHYFAGLSQASAAATLGLREGTVAMRLTRARDRLGKILAGRGMALGGPALVGLLLASPAPAMEPTLLARIRPLMTAPGTVPPRHLHGAGGGHLAKTIGLGVGAAATLVIANALWLNPKGTAPHPRPDESTVLAAKPIPQQAPIQAPEARSSVNDIQAFPGNPPEDSPRLTLKVRNMNLQDVCTWIMRLSETTITLVDVQKQDVSVEFQETPLEEVLAILGQRCDLTVKRINVTNWQLSGKPAPALPHTGG